MSNAIEHPSHYQHPSGVEAIDICEHLGFNLGNAYKYLARAGKKGPAAEDLRKAAWCLRREAAMLTVCQMTSNNIRYLAQDLARAVLRTGVDGKSWRSFLIFLESGGLTTKVMLALADECEREAASAESAK